MNIAQIARRITGANNAWPIEIQNNDKFPRLVGRPYFWTTPGGKPIWYPNAYKWPKIYHASTMKVVVGKDFIDAIYSNDSH